MPADPPGWRPTGRWCGSNAVVAINRAVAVAEHRGPDVALAALDTVDHDAVDAYQPYHAARADLLARTGRTAEAIMALRPGHRAHHQPRRTSFPRPTA